jgi:protein TonB
VSVFVEESQNSAVSTLDRFSFVLFLATALHAAIILGITFVDLPKRSPDITMEITLAQHPTSKPNPDADFLAQANQAGSGSADEAHVVSTNQQSTFEDDRIREQSALKTPAPPQVTPEVNPTPSTEQTSDKPANDTKKAIEQKPMVASNAKNETKTAQKQTPKPEPKAASTSGQSTSLLARSLDLANLQAEIRLEQQAVAKRPKVRTLTSASTTAYDDAVYLNNWRNRIEQIGNMNYPEEARKRGVFGTLRLAVMILPDGRLQSVEILQSSGHKVLDDAAIRIVRLAAPFQPFTPEMRRKTDVLEIIRTWKFEKNTRLY